MPTTGNIGISRGRRPTVIRYGIPYGCQTVLEEVAGKTFDRHGWTVKRRRFRCRCTCGNVALVYLSALLLQPPRDRCFACPKLPPRKRQPKGV